MYQIDVKKNDIIKLEQRQFQELGFRERDNLQEWIEKNPEVLDPELLIIQKEYDGFNDTRERLDLLAVDKDGNLVIIENKLDDTGRNVIWQALKYASYCSTLTTTQTVKIFQEYLDEQGAGENAKEVLLEFLELDDEDQLLLNEGDQRIIFVANNFRKEVTSTVLWLLNHDINIQCFRATPYSRGEDMFLQIEQIIPLPETQEFIIDAKEKEREDKSVSKRVTEGRNKLIDFWGQLKVELKTRDFDLLDKVGAKGYYSIGSFVGRGKFCFCIGKHAIRIELYIPNDKEKVLFDTMFEMKEEIQNRFQKEIVWERLDLKKASRIKHEIAYRDLYPEYVNFYDQDAIDKWVEWYADHMKLFYEAVLPTWNKVR